MEFVDRLNGRIGPYRNERRGSIDRSLSRARKNPINVLVFEHIREAARLLETAFGKRHVEPFALNEIAFLGRAFGVSHKDKRRHMPLLFIKNSAISKSSGVSMLIESSDPMTYAFTTFPIE